MSPAPGSPTGPLWKEVPVSRAFFYIFFRVSCKGPSQYFEEVGLKIMKFLNMPCFPTASNSHLVPNIVFRKLFGPNIVFRKLFGPNIVLRKLLGPSIVLTKLFSPLLFLEDCSVQYLPQNFVLGHPRPVIFYYSQRPSIAFRDIVGSADIQ
jgi:hypothetical protein